MKGEKAMMYNFGRGFAGGWAPFGWAGIIFAAIFIALVVTFIIIVVRNVLVYTNSVMPPHGAPYGAPPHAQGIPPAEQILKERLAKGEIDEAQYDSILKKLRE
jgi:uncharacterized membrane protein